MEYKKDGNWYARYGTFKINEMEAYHIINAINYLLVYQKRNESSEVKIEELKEELDKRGIDKSRCLDEH